MPCLDAAVDSSAETAVPGLAFCPRTPRNHWDASRCQSIPQGCDCISVLAVRRPIWKKVQSDSHQPAESKLSALGHKQPSADVRFRYAGSLALNLVENAMTIRKNQPTIHIARLASVWAFIGCCLPAGASGCPTAIAGPTMNWVVSVCEARVETDDFDNPKVQACVKRVAQENHVSGDPYENCPVNRKLKTELCGAWVKLGTEKDLRACIKSSDTVPKGVSQGLGP